jgi:pilus assembly protein Flp/PilA
MHPPPMPPDPCPEQSPAVVPLLVRHHLKENAVLKLFITLQALVADRAERDDRGATAVEYGLMVALIAAVIIGTVTLLGDSLEDKFRDVADAVTKAGN